MMARVTVASIKTKAISERIFGVQPLRAPAERSESGAIERLFTTLEMTGT